MNTEVRAVTDIYHTRWNGEGEPYFVIRGKDKFAVVAILAWLKAARMYDEAETERTGFISEPLKTVIKSASNVLQSVMSWQANFGVKVPDLPADASPLKFAKNRHRTSDFGTEHLLHVNPDGTDKVLTASVEAPAAPTGTVAVGPLMTFSAAFLDSWLEDAPDEAKRHWQRVKEAALRSAHGESK